MEAVAVDRGAECETGILTRQRAFVSLEEGRQAAKDIRAASQAAGMAEMTMEEIDAVIAECRREWRQSVGQ